MIFMRILFFALLRVVVFVAFGINVRHVQRIPKAGPAIIVANHNSHLDALVLMSLFPTRQLSILRPVAAADYFTRRPFLAWFTRAVLQSILITREPGQREKTMAALSHEISQGHILILFPEGTRGSPERLSKFKTGITHLLERHPDVPVYPVFMQGLGKILPKNDWVPVPFIINVLFGEPVYWSGNHQILLDVLYERMQHLASEGRFASWE
jgi:1-acyl-sn-glycerol-3-phosphate acyltransferase